MKFISGKKLSMTQIWVGDNVVAVTPVLAGPCTITQVKTTAKDKYEALQLAYGTRKAKNIKKPQLGHYKATKVSPAYVREFRLDEAANFKAGDVITVETFATGDKVAVTGTSKGKGFQGVVKRHGFHGFRKTHGNKDQERMPGSIGPKGPAHVFKGMRMAGRMGGEQVTVTNLEVASVDAANNILFIKGALPGAINGFVSICGPGDLQVNLKAANSVAPSEEVQAAAEVPTAEPAAVVEPVAVVTEAAK
jgi:large subunit ribosomal protein L3